MALLDFSNDIAPHGSNYELDTIITQRLWRSKNVSAVLGHSTSRDDVIAHLWKMLSGPGAPPRGRWPSKPLYSHPHKQTEKLKTITASKKLRSSPLSPCSMKKSCMYWYRFESFRHVWSVFWWAALTSDFHLWIGLMCQQAFLEYLIQNSHRVTTEL